MSREQVARKELAAAFRWAARLNFHEAVANHFSMAVSDDGQQFVVNRAGTHFSQVTASGLVMVDTAMKGDPLQYGVDPTAWVLHSYLHRNVPHAKCVLHTHMPYTTALACLKDFEFLMLDQNACAFHGRIAYDRHYAGMALDPTEGERIASLLVDGKDVLFMGNHGVMVVGVLPREGSSIASACTVHWTTTAVGRRRNRSTCRQANSRIPGGSGTAF
jgi:ribulose-5-phosphate 4-epimerase/fuculose-1-phosphate aldolase